MRVKLIEVRQHPKLRDPSLLVWGTDMYVCILLKDVRIGPQSFLNGYLNSKGFQRMDDDTRG